MALEPYSFCPCGSGKKFKWCCQPIHTEIDKAFKQEADGQHEAALRTMDEVIAQHPDNPEVYGRKAQLLYTNQKVEEAESTLQKALDLNPTYPFGHLLRGLFRINEGEVPGAVLLFRKAAGYYSPEARDQLSQIYQMIGENELKLNRPVAARVAFQIALHHQPADPNLRQAVEALSSDQTGSPAVARHDYQFQGPPASLPAERRAAWDQALAGAATGKLSDAAQAFDQLAQSDPDISAAWYNLGIVRSWLGDNRGAIEALGRYAELEPDEARVAAAWALAEVLRFGYGMEDQADYVEYSYLFRMRDPRPVVAFLQDLERQRRFLLMQTREDQFFVVGLILEATTGLTEEHQASRLPRLGAYLLISNEILRLSHTNPEAVDHIRTELREKAGGALSEPQLGRGPATMSDVFADALVFPTGSISEEAGRDRVREHMRHHYEEAWVHQPRRSLDGVAPVDAAGHPVLRKKLRGVIQFLEECAAGGPHSYDFDRLRRKLGLLSDAPVAGAAMDIPAMGAAELAGLTVETLSDDQLEQAFQTALKLDARDLAGRFATSLVGRPANPDKPDRWPAHAHLVQLALSQGDTDRALDQVNQGEKHDCEHNEGRRRNDYELRRAQIHARRGEIDSAVEVFQRLIDRVPGEMRYRGGAVEALLSAKQGARALGFAEAGLALARQKNDRDSEQYFLELVAAAKK